MKYEKAKEVVIVWKFKNEYWEEFVVFFCKKNTIPNVLCITGDEFDWEIVELYLIWARDWVRVIATNKWFTWRFLFSLDESRKITQIVKEFNEDIIDWLMASKWK